MRHESIEVVCAHVRQDQAPPPRHSDVLGMLAYIFFLISGYKQIKISQEEGLSHHYRICEYGGYDCLKKSSVNDSTALKWGSQLIGRVDKTCQEIFGEGKSCPEAPPLGSPW